MRACVGRYDHRGAVVRGSVSVEAGKRSARFRQDERGGCIVPGHQPHLEIEFGLSGGHEAEFHGGASCTADVVAVHVQVVDDVAAGFCEFLPVGGHGREKEPLLEGTVRYPDRRPVAEGAFPGFGGIKFTAPGAVNDPEKRLPVPDEGDADAAARDAPGVVRRSVYRVDDPDIFVVEVREVFLLAEEAAPGEKFRQSSGQEVLHGHVGGRHDILPGALIVHLEPSRPVHQRPRFPDDLDDLLNVHTTKLRKRGKRKKPGTGQAFSCRGDVTRTHDPLVPNQMR